MDELTDYEKERAARLAQNQAMLSSLGIAEAAHELEQVVVQEDELAKQQVEEAEERLRLASLVSVGGVRRRSSRLKGNVVEDGMKIGGTETGVVTEVGLRKGNAKGHVVQRPGRGRVKQHLEEAKRKETGIVKEKGEEKGKVKGKELEEGDSLEEQKERDTEEKLASEEGLEVEDELEEDQEVEDEKELEEEDYRPDFGDLSAEEESEHEAAGESSEDAMATVGGSLSKKPARKRRRNGRVAQSATKASKSRTAEMVVEGGLVDMDEDELELQKALAMSMIDAETPTPNPQSLSKPSTSSRNTKPKPKPKPESVSAKPKNPQPENPQPDFYSSAQDVRDQILAHQAMQSGALRAAQRTFFQQRTAGVSAQTPSDTGPLGPTAGSVGNTSTGENTNNGGNTSIGGNTTIVGNNLEAGGSEIGVPAEAKSGGGLRLDEQGGEAEAVGNGSKGVNRRKQKARKPAAQPPTHEEVDALFHIFDDRGGGQLSLADVRHVAEAHDFTWSDEQLADMIGMFDADCNGLLDQDDFRHLVRHCKVVLS